MITLRVERGHIVLKSKLGVSISDLLTIMTNIDSFLWNQHQQYIITLGKIRNNTPIILKKANTIIYRDLSLYITFFALLKIHTQYHCLANKSQSLPPYHQQFTSIIGLPYIYQIKISIIIQFLRFNY